MTQEMNFVIKQIGKIFESIQVLNSLDEAPTELQKNVLYLVGKCHIDISIATERSYILTGVTMN